MYKEDSSFIGVFLLILVVSVPVFSLLFVRFQLSNNTVSGIVYNTANDQFISGATCFGVRASESTYVNEETKSTYCVPKYSEYKPLINRAAADKRVKVVVTSSKFFTVQLPWTVYPNVKVTEVK